MIKIKSLTLLREHKDMSQVELAEYLGISVQRYHQYEKGRRAMPVEIAKKAADYFNVTLEDIFFGDDLNAMLNKGKEKQKSA
ncbi:MAG: helix-turn-helix transcriptional regulator [Halanaerobiales bacterium]